MKDVMTKQEQKDRILKLQSQYRKLFLASDIGRAVLLDIIRLSGVLSSPYCAGSVEATHIKIGKADVGRAILDLLKVRSLEGLDELEEDYHLSYAQLYGEEEYHA